MPKQPFLQGFGVWIWKIRDCEGGDIGAIVAKATATGLSHVLLKAADGVSPYNTPRLFPLAAALKVAGVEPILWQYARGLEPEREAALFACTALRSGYSRMLVLDLEQEFKDKPEKARRYISLLRPCAGSPPPYLALSSYYLPNNHPTFPWDRLVPQCDLYMPQVYWYARDPVWALEESLRQTERFGLPRFVTGQAYEAGGHGTPTELDRFLAAVVRKKLWGANLWAWHTMTASHWNVLRSYATDVP